MIIWGHAAGRRAVHVAGVPQEGMAVDVAGPSGVVEFTEDQPYDVDSRDDKQRIPFQLSEVGCKLRPPLGILVVISQDCKLVPLLDSQLLSLPEVANFCLLWEFWWLSLAEVRCQSLSPLGFLVVVTGCPRVRLGGTVQRSIRPPLCFTAAFSCCYVSQQLSQPRATKQESVQARLCAVAKSPAHACLAAA